jgi:hypothetical protein
MLDGGFLDVEEIGDLSSHMRRLLARLLED